MANYSLKTNIQRGKFKGKTVSQLAMNKDGQSYLMTLHNNKKYNIRLTEEVLDVIKQKTIA